MRDITRLFIVAVALTMLSGCAAKVATDFKELPAPTIPTQQQRAEGQAFAAHMVRSSKLGKPVQGQHLARVQKIVRNLERAAGYKEGTFPVNVVDMGDDANAMVYQGATVVVYDKLIERVPDNTELAAVLGHEMGHVLAQHHNKKSLQERSQSVGTASSILGTIASVAMSATGNGGFARSVGGLTQGATAKIGTGIMLSYDRAQEYEADRLGLLLMAKAGYDPQAAPKFWARSKEVFGSEKSTAAAFFSTHPASQDRREELEKAMPMALALYHPAAEGNAKKGNKKARSSVARK